MSKRITLEDDEIKLIAELLDDALGQRSNIAAQLSRVAKVTADRLYAKLDVAPATDGEG